MLGGAAGAFSSASGIFKELEEQLLLIIILSGERRGHCTRAEFVVDLNNLISIQNLLKAMKVGANNK